MGNDYMSHGEYQKAIDCYNEALQIDPYNRDAWFYAAKAYECLSDWDHERDYCDRVLEINSNDVDALLLRGTIFSVGFGDSHGAN